MRKTLLVTTLLALFSAVPAAQAASTASATLDMSNFKVSFLEGSGSFAFDRAPYASAYAYDYTGGASDNNYYSANASVAGVAASSISTAKTLSASVDAQYSADPYGYGSGNAYASGGAGAWAYSTVTLDPYSDMLIRVPYALTITGANLSGEYAYASVSLSADRLIGGSLSISNTANLGMNGLDPSLSNNGKLGLFLSNTTATEQTFSVYAYAGTQASTVAAVPEPETYSMMMAGLGLLGFVARKRNQPAA